jgi:hypothetical protein
MLTHCLSIVTQQIHEMDSIRRKLWDLEQTQLQIKKQYVSVGFNPWMLPIRRD